MFGGEAAVVREKNFQLLLLVSALVPFGNGLLSPILDSLIGPFGASAANIGLMISVFWLPSIVVIPLVGVLADRYGRKPVLVPSLVVFGLGGTAIAFTTDFRVALALRLLQGVGWAGLTALIVTSIGDFYAGAKEATAQGIRQTGTNLAGSAISLLAGAAVVLAWQYPFLLYVLAFPAAAAVHLWFDEPTASDGYAATDGGEDGAGPYRRELVALVRRRRVLAILSGRSLPTVVWIGFTTYNSIIVVRLLDGTPTQAGVLYAIASLVVAVTASQAGRATAALGDRYTLLFGANVLLGVGFAVVAFAPGLVVAGVGVTVMGAGFGIVLPLYRSLLTGFAPASLRAGLVSIGSTGGRVMGIVTPLAMGGAIAALSPVVGFSTAVQFSGLGAAAVGAGGGVACVLVARVSPPVALEE